jgi:hypothetical protein
VPVNLFNNSLMIIFFKNKEFIFLNINRHFILSEFRKEKIYSLKNESLLIKEVCYLDTKIV